MPLTVLHYHFRPGGVRRVIEQTLPALVAEAGISLVVLAGGEAPDAGWRQEMEAALHPCAVEWCIEPALGYWSEQTEAAAAVQGKIREALRRIKCRGGIVHAHNLSVGRNMLLSREVAATNFERLWLHHHDWWWDGRWERWPEMAGQGIVSLEEAIVVTLPRGAGVRHFCVNAADARRMEEWTGQRFHFLPNVAPPAVVSAGEAEAARDFLRRAAGGGSWWLYPCRGLRRKNIAEALLVQRLLAPEAVTVTTGGASSEAERGYFAALTEAAARHGWPLRAGICAEGECPPVSHLLAAADVAVVTSLREGFGLPFYEAAGRPLAARIPSGLEETLRATGFVPRHGWREMRVPADSFDAGAEAARTAAGRQRLCGMLPPELHGLVRGWLPEDQAAPDFGALSLAAQLEALCHPVAALRRSCVALNPVLQAPLSVQAGAEKMQSPREWAAALLTAARSSGIAPARAGLTGEALRFLTPLVQDWLRFPLLWESAPVQP